MKRAIIHPFDDIDHAADGTLTPADRVNVPLRFGDSFVSLDLTQAHYDEIAASLKHLLSLGRQLQPVLQKGRRQNSYYTAARAWADTAEVVYTFPGGGVDYRRLRRLYDAHLAATADKEVNSGESVPILRSGKDDM